jgi:nitrogen fixation protein NifZ
MGDINREPDTVELAEPPRFSFGERVICRSTVRNDGTFAGRDIGYVLVKKGDVGYVRSIGTFLQQYYIYSVEWVERGYQVGMRAKELCTLDKLPPEVLEKFADQLAILQRIGKGDDVVVKSAQEMAGDAETA